MYKYLLFDLDNTLLDFDAAELRSLQKTFSKFNVPITLENISNFKSINKKYWEMFERKEITKSELIIKRFDDFFKTIGGFSNLDPREVNCFYLCSLTDEAEEMPYANYVLSNLEDKYEIVIVTNGVKDTQIKRIQKSSFFNKISKIYISETIGVQKPEKGFFDYIFNDLNIQDSNEVLLIGDSLSADIIGGLNYGIDTVWYNYNKKESNILPKYVISDLRDLLKIL